MAVYLIADLDVSDPEAFEEYRRQVGPLLEQYGARTLVRGGAIEILEGEWEPKRLIMLEFSDMDALKGFYDSDDYKGLKGLRQRAAVSKVLAVQGA